MAKTILFVYVFNKKLKKKKKYFIVNNELIEWLVLLYKCIIIYVLYFYIFIDRGKVPISNE